MDCFNSKWFYSILIVCLVLLFAIIKSIGSFVVSLNKDGFIQNEVFKNSITANAIIIASSQTTIWRGGRPVYRLTLKFQTPLKQKVEALLKKEFTFDESERSRLGNVVTIKYDPKNLQRIALYHKPRILDKE